VRDGEQQGASTILSAAYSVDSGKYRDEDLLHDGLWVIDAVCPEVANNRRCTSPIKVFERSLDRSQFSHIVPIDRRRIATSGSGSDPNRTVARPPRPEWA
jgi:hypothetical protein